MATEPQTTSPRQDLMALLAQASQSELDAVIERFAPLPRVEDVRPAEVGLCMVRGRIGGDGSPFNLGEATITRAAVRLNAIIGVSYLLGRDPERARAAALIDALWQDTAARPAVEEALAPVQTRLTALREVEAASTDATRVEFFTLVRGED
ncbi:phosphonate C-P lyase system protein PhnG [Aquabacter cavernae]|uniref:phosphonate C-P lyase system protein PhnG n=1 Tax=Aquabacter cavernae TaxID=2496029 RepID=UPI000F8EC7FC|nr:phosphonate C-P lyase system protein PhnG [Aquabacter cavernae]